MCVHVVHGVKKHRYSRRTKRGEKYLNYASRHHEPPYRNLLYLYRKVYRNRLNINTISPQCQPKRVVDFWFFDCRTTIGPAAWGCLNSDNSSRLCNTDQQFGRRPLYTLRTHYTHYTLCAHYTLYDHHTRTH